MTGLNAHKVSMDANRVCRGAQRRMLGGFLANLASRGAEMRRTADLTRASVRSERILEKRFRAVRMRLPAGSRETERVRMQRMEKAAKSEGWTP